MPEIVYLLDKESNETLQDLFFNADQRLYLNRAIVQADNGDKYPVFFVHPIRVLQELEHLSEHNTHFAERGMILVLYFTPEHLQKVVEQSWKDGYFDHQKPIE